jgi:hypothetical protein
MPPLAQRRSVERTMTLLDKLSTDDDEDDRSFLGEEEEEEKRDNLGSMGDRPSYEHGGVHVDRPSRAATLESLAATLEELAALADEVTAAEVATYSTAVRAYSGAEAVQAAVLDALAEAHANQHIDCSLRRADTPARRTARSTTAGDRGPPSRCSTLRRAATVKDARVQAALHLISSRCRPLPGSLTAAAGATLGSNRSIQSPVVNSKRLPPPQDSWPAPPPRPTLFAQAVDACRKPRKIMHAVAAWWAIQPKLALGLVWATLAAYVVLVTMASMSRACTAQYWGITGTIFGVMAVLLGAASWLQLRHISSSNSSSSSDGDGSSKCITDGDRSITPNMAAVTKSTFASVDQQKQQQEQQQKEPSPVVCKDIEWTQSHMLYFPPIMVFVGIICGFVGSSPNTLFLTPLMLSLGQYPKARHVDARVVWLSVCIAVGVAMTLVLVSATHVRTQVTSATLHLALFMTAAASSLGYLLADRLVVSQGLAHGITGMICAPLGLLAVDLWVRRTGRASIIMAFGVVRCAAGQCSAVLPACLLVLPHAVCLSAFLHNLLA